MTKKNESKKGVTVSTKRKFCLGPEDAAIVVRKDKDPNKVNYEFILQNNKDSINEASSATIAACVLGTALKSEKIMAELYEIFDKAVESINNDESE